MGIVISSDYESKYPRNDKGELHGISSLRNNYTNQCTYQTWVKDKQHGLTVWRNMNRNKTTYKRMYRNDVPFGEEIDYRK